MGSVFPLPLSDYPALPGAGLIEVIQQRALLEPFNIVATAIFLLAIVHTFLVARVTAFAHRIQHEHNARQQTSGAPPTPSVLAECLHFFGEVEVVFGLWVIPLLITLSLYRGGTTTAHYLNDTVNYTEALFVVVIMVLASSRPVVTLAELGLRRIAMLGRCTPAAWWVTILTVGPVLGSFITEPAAMTICALLLSRQFFALEPSARFKYATLGLLFVNVSIGGTLTHFAAPPVLMVARTWDWGTGFMLDEFGWKAVSAILFSTAIYFALFWRELQDMARREEAPDPDPPSEEEAVALPALLPVPPWVTVVHLVFMTWTIVYSHYPALFVGGFFFFLGFTGATAVYQNDPDLKAPLLVGFFLAGLVIHGGLQGWWIAPVLASLSELPLFVGSTVLTAFNDNALITYLGTLVPGFDDPHKIALVAGAVTGGGLTVIANAPNPAGQALLARFFDGAVKPLGLLAAALLPTMIAATMFRIL